MVAAGGRDATAAERAIDQCESIWADGYRHAERLAMEHLVSEHASALSVGRRQYEGVIDRVRSDDDFLTYLGRHVASIEAAGGAETGRSLEHTHP